jgi:hypothetical protein
MKLQRYLGNDEWGDPDPHEGGDFVLYDDHAKAIAAERERAKPLIEFIEEVRDECDSADSWEILIPVAIMVLAQYNESEGGE